MGMFHSRSQKETSYKFHLLSKTSSTEYQYSQCTENEIDEYSSLELFTKDLHLHQKNKLDQSTSFVENELGSSNSENSGFHDGDDRNFPGKNLKKCLSIS